MKTAVTVLTLTCACSGVFAGLSTYSGVNGTYPDARAAFLDDFMALTGETVPLEDFDALPSTQPVGDMPNNPARFAEEDADGSFLPLPVIQVFAGAPSGSQWIANFGNGRPTGASWVIRPDNPGDSIYAFGQTNAQGDWVRVSGFDASDNLVVSLDASNLGQAFAGFISDVPLAKVVVTPLGNGDFANGMDDVFVSVTPVPTPMSVAPLALCAAAMRRRR